MYLPPNNQLAGLSGNIFSKIGKSLKKVVKTASKLSLSQQLLKKVNPTLAPLLSSAPKAKPVVAVEAPTVPAIVTPPEPVAAPQTTPSILPAVAPPAPSPAPPPAAESFAMPLQPAPSTFFGPAPSAVPDTTAPAAPAPSSNLPLILGAAGLGLAAILFLGKKKGR